MAGPERSNAFTGQYAAACVALAAELGLPSLDLWTAFQAEPAGWEGRLLMDGLHLSDAGNARCFELLRAVIKTELPHVK